MSNEIDWIKPRITEARKAHSPVTQAVLARIEKMLSGILSEKQLTPAELAKLAGDLVSDMNDAPPLAEKKQ